MGACQDKVQMHRDNSISLIRLTATIMIVVCHMM